MKFTRIAALIMAAAMATVLVSCKDTEDKNNDTQQNTTFVEGLDENGHFEGVKASEIVTLPEYEGIEIDKSVTTVSEEDLQEQIDIILEDHVTYEQIKEGTIEDGTTVNIDYVGSVDGVEFSGGSTGGMGTIVTIGVTNYIDGFLEQLIGHKPGENFDINVTFPDPYENNTELSGKDAVFNITVNYIQGEAIEAELTDKLASEYGFENVDALKADISEWLLFSQAYEVFNTIVEGTVCENIPDSVIDYFKNIDMKQYEYYASMYGVTVEEFITQYGEYESVDAYIEERMESYKEQAKICLTAQAIAELENITVSSEYVTNSNYADYVAQYGEAYIKQFLLTQEVIPDFIVENAKVAE